jgi:hypothetical protein
MNQSFPEKQETLSNIVTVEDIQSVLQDLFPDKVNEEDKLVR